MVTPFEREMLALCEACPAALPVEWMHAKEWSGGSAGKWQAESEQFHTGRLIASEHRRIADERRGTWWENGARGEWM